MKKTEILMQGNSERDGNCLGSLLMLYIDMADSRFNCIFFLLFILVGFRLSLLT